MESEAKMQGEASASIFARHGGARPSLRLWPCEQLLLSDRRGQEDAWNLLAVPVLPALAPVSSHHTGLTCTSGL